MKLLEALALVCLICFAISVVLVALHKKPSHKFSYRIVQVGNTYRADLLDHGRKAHAVEGLIDGKNVTTSVSHPDSITINIRAEQMVAAANKKFGVGETVLIEDSAKPTKEKKSK